MNQLRGFGDGDEVARAAMADAHFLLRGGIENALDTRLGFENGADFRIQSRGR